MLQSKVYGSSKMSPNTSKRMGASTSAPIKRLGHSNGAVKQLGHSNGGSSGKSNSNNEMYPLY